MDGFPNDRPHTCSSSNGDWSILPHVFMLLGLKLANDTKRLRSTQDYDDTSRYEI